MRRIFLSCANFRESVQQLSSLSAVAKYTGIDLMSSMYEYRAIAWQRVVSLLPSLGDVQLLAAPKRKVRQVVHRHINILSYSLFVKMTVLGAGNASS